MALRLLCVFALSLLVLNGCQPTRRLTKANVDLITEGMAKKQVESILGLPTAVDNKDFVVMKKTVYVYTQSNGSVTVTFREDKVEEKDSTLTE